MSDIYIYIYIYICIIFCFGHCYFLVDSLVYINIVFNFLILDKVLIKLYTSCVLCGVLFFNEFGFYLSKKKKKGKKIDEVVIISSVLNFHVIIICELELPNCRTNYKLSRIEHLLKKTKKKSSVLVNSLK